MKRRKVGRDYTKRIELDLELRDGSLGTLLEKHWSTDTDPNSIAAEATVWLRSRKLPDLPTAGCSLSHHLRSDYGAHHDSLDDLAARIIDEVVCLELMGSVPRSIPVAVELGKLHALFSIYRQLDDTRQKPRKTKRAVWAELGKSLGDASSKKEAWKILAEKDVRIEAWGDHWVVYPDGEKLCAVNKRTGVEISITRATFFRWYVKLR